MEVGMSRDSVKYGRIPKKQKAKMIEQRKNQWLDQTRLDQIIMRIQGGGKNANDDNGNNRK